MENGVLDYNGLEARLKAISGADKDIDAAIAARFAVPVADFTASVEACRSLVGAVLPGWRLHVGWGASGLFPYGTLAKDGVHCAAEAPTVPLAILRALVDAARVAPPPGG